MSEPTYEDYVRDEAFIADQRGTGVVLAVVDIGCSSGTLLKSLDAGRATPDLARMAFGEVNIHKAD